MLKVYKGTDKDMKCRGMQYELGKKETTDDAIRCGDKGFHSCERPLDVFGYYAPASSRYFVAEADGKIDKCDDDSKIASSELTLKGEIGIAGLVKAHIEYTKKHCTMENTDPKMATAGDSGAATAGDSGAATAGDSGAATAGSRGAATAGSYGAATAGSRGAATAGSYGAATAGSYGAATAGSYGAATAGFYGAATAGFRGAATAGDYGAATSKGKSAVGKNGLAVARGNNVRVKGGIGAILVIAEENDDNCDIREWKAEIVDGENIKVDTWYKLKNGKFVEVEDNA